MGCVVSTHSTGSKNPRYLWLKLLTLGRNHSFFSAHLNITANGHINLALLEAKPCGGFHKWRYSKMDGLFHGTCEHKMDENWGHSYFRNPPCHASFWESISLNQCHLHSRGEFKHVKRSPISQHQLVGGFNLPL